MKPAINGNPFFGEFPVESAGHAMALLRVRSRRVLLPALANGANRPVELERATGLSSSTIRRDLQRFSKARLVAKRALGGVERAVEYPLTKRGKDGLIVIAAAKRWLARRPEGALSVTAEEATKPLISLDDAWGHGLLQRLATQPRARSELEAMIPASHYVIRERLQKLVRDGLADMFMDDTGQRSYELTRWGRLGVGTLSLGGLWQHRHFNGTAKTATPADVISALMIAAPLVRLSGRASGVCELAVHPDDEWNGHGGSVTIHVTLEDGCVVDCSLQGTQSTPPPLARAWAPTGAWLAALVEGEIAALDLGGDAPEIAIDLTRTIHEELYRRADSADTEAVDSRRD